MASKTETRAEDDTNEVVVPEFIEATGEIVDAPRVEPAEIVERPSRELEPVTPPTALERAAEAALAMPGIPGRDEFLSLAMQARILSMSGLVPKALRDNPHITFHIAMIGRDLGISPSAAVELIDVIGEGNNAQASLSPQLLLGQIRRLGIGSIRPTVKETNRAVASAYGPDGTLLGDSEFTWEDAQVAGLVDARCEPADHKSGCRCRQGWKTYPKRMLWWRAAGYAADDFFPEAGLGLYTAEELGAVVDGEGRPLDPATVSLPDGYEPKQRAIPPSETPAQPDTLDAFRGRIAQLRRYTGAAERLAELWKEKQFPAIDDLSFAQQKPVSALIDLIERQAAKGDYGEPGADPVASEATAEAKAEAAEAERTAALDGADDQPESDVGPEDSKALPDVGSPDTPPESPESRSVDVSAVDLSFDPTDLPTGTTADDDAVWLARAPEALQDEVIEEVRTIPVGDGPESLKSRAKALGIAARGGEDDLRRKLAIRLVRRRMEREIASALEAHLNRT